MSSSAAAEAPVSGYAAFQHRDFALYAVARFFSNFGTQVQNVAVGWLVYDLTANAFALGLVGLASFTPAIALALVTGHVADRFDRRGVLVVCYAMAFLSASGLLVAATVESSHVWPIYLLLLLFGVSRAFSRPADQALMPNLVPPEHFRNAIAWSSSIGQFATIVGPAGGGILYAFGGPIVFGAVAFCFAFCFVLYALIRRRPPSAARERASWATLLAGLFFIRSRPVVLGAISLDLFAVLLGGATALLPIYAKDILHVGPAGLGLLRSMPAVGALLMALLLAHRPLNRRAGRRMFEAVALFGLATIGFGLSTSLILSLACLFIMGVADMVSVFVRQTLVQIETPDAMRGRVAAVNTIFIGASNELGEFESGTLAALIGAMPAVVLGGAGTLLVAALWSRWFPALRDRDSLMG
jgi:MFS family permease